MRYYPSVPCGFTSDRFFLSQKKNKNKKKKLDFPTFLSSTFSNVPCAWDLHSGLPSIEAGGLYGAHYPSGKVRKILVSMVYLVQTPKSGSNFGTEGAPPPLYSRPLSVPDKLSRTTLLILLDCQNITSHQTRELAPAVRDHNDALAL